jgi:hypothetical protein
MPMKRNSTLAYLVKKVSLLQDAPAQLVNRGTGQENPIMDNAIHTPSEEVIQRILDFAMVYDVVKTKSTGPVEMILN